MRAVGSGTAAMLPCSAASSAPAQPRYETVAQFYRTCADETNRKANGRCEAYLAGAAETLSAFGNGGSEAGICCAGASAESVAGESEHVPWLLVLRATGSMASVGPKRRPSIVISSSVVAPPCEKQLMGWVSDARSSGTTV